MGTKALQCVKRITEGCLGVLNFLIVIVSGPVGGVRCKARWKLQFKYQYQIYNEQAMTENRESYSQDT